MANLITGSDGANTLTGTSGDDVIYGYNPDASTHRTATSITAERVASGLDQPLFAGAPKGDPSRLFIVEKKGVIKILDLDSGNVLATPFLDVSGEVQMTGEKGLLGLAFDPDFADNGFFYVNLINLAGDTEVRRYSVSADPDVADPASETLILTFDQPNSSSHKAGWIGFGPDGHLYIASGDGGGAGDPNNNAQNVNSLLGKILRVDVSADAFPDPLRNYAIPADNPFVDTAGADEIYALGLRNPFRDSFDRALGTFFIADVGQKTWEEINLGQNGANYGWKVFEGPERFSDGNLTAGTRVDPIHIYPQDVGQSVIGGYVYRGEGEALQGQFIFADFTAGTISALRKSGSSWIATDLTNKIDTDSGAINLPSSFGEDGFGNLYVVDLDGEVFKLTPNSQSNDLGDTLSGGAGNDMLFAGSGNDILIGGSGADLLNGGLGMDTASYAASPQAVTVNLQTGVGLGGDAEGDRLQGIENLIGSAHGDTLIGNGANNVFQPGSGADTVNGNGRIDTVIYATSPQGVTVDLQAGTGGGGDAQGDSLHSIENVIGSAHADDLKGTGGSNVFHPGAGNDIIDGRGGMDTVSYSNIAQGVIVNLSAMNNQATGSGIGIDQLVNIENVTGSRGNDNLTGNASANVLSGVDGNDSIVGGGGHDSLAGGAGADSLNGGDGNDTQTGGSGNDKLNGDAGNDTLDGGSGDDKLDGGDGKDFMSGGSGRDFFTGGAGSDRFDFNLVSDSKTGSARDKIIDFKHSQGDKIDLSGIDARTNTSGNNAFKFIGDKAFSKTAGELRFKSNIVQGDVNGDGIADFEIHVNVSKLVAGDFVL
ncbi:MAG TPA: PQQ-dependent sugar dehydrogenase [Methyloceanibacter sp.]|nr:PQQ-dependent sugar dehydrogenase [Methyloceanibacter sp.]